MDIDIDVHVESSGQAINQTAGKRKERKKETRGTRVSHDNRLGEASLCVWNNLGVLYGCH